MSFSLGPAREPATPPAASLRPGPLEVAKQAWSLFPLRAQSLFGTLIDNPGQKLESRTNSGRRAEGLCR